MLFHRIANTLNYLDIKTVIVSCGTCHDQLRDYQFDKIFPGCRLLDIHEYLLEKNVKLDGVSGVRIRRSIALAVDARQGQRRQFGQCRRARALACDSTLS